MKQMRRRKKKRSRMLLDFTDGMLREDEQAIMRTEQCDLCPKPFDNHQRKRRVAIGKRGCPYNTTYTHTHTPQHNTTQSTRQATTPTCCERIRQSDCAQWQRAPWLLPCSLSDLRPFDCRRGSR